MTTTCLLLAAPAVGRGERPRLDLAELLARARTFPRVEAARQAARAQAAKIDEVRALAIPQLEITTVGGPSPEVTCIPSADACTTTDPKELRIGFGGAFFRAEARTTAPLYSFGKLLAGKRAATFGYKAAESLASAAEADTLLEAARAYFGVKLARELLVMLDEGAEHVDKALARVEEGLDAGAADVTFADQFRLRAVRAEIDARRAETRRLEATALAGVRLLAQDPSADVDMAPLTLVAATRVPGGDPSGLRKEAEANRPEGKAAKAGVEAMRALTQLEKARVFPDLVLVAQAVLARADGADDPRNAFYNDPLNTTVVSGGIALRWVIDVFARRAKIEAARAEAARAEETFKLVQGSVGFEAERALAESVDAQARIEAAERGERASRSWLVATLQAAEAGLAETKELADALIMYFTMRGRLLQATFDTNVAAYSLIRATGGDLSKLEASAKK